LLLCLLTQSKDLLQLRIPLNTPPSFLKLKESICQEFCEIHIQTFAANWTQSVFCPAKLDHKEEPHRREQAADLCSDRSITSLGGKSSDFSSTLAGTLFRDSITC
jgi:hypothetical protein